MSNLSTITDRLIAQSQERRRIQQQEANRQANNDTARENALWQVKMHWNQTISDFDSFLSRYNASSTESDYTVELGEELNLLDVTPIHQRYISVNIDDDNKRTVVGAVIEIDIHRNITVDYLQSCKELNFPASKMLNNADFEQIVSRVLEPYLR